jgi:alpha/beta hydrolase family protein
MFRITAVSLHGYAQTRHMWRPLMQPLAQEHTVIVSDLRGAGGSMLVPWLLNPLIGNQPLALQALFIAMGIVILLTWVVMPVLVRILRPWLEKRSSQGR